MPAWRFLADLQGDFGFFREGRRNMFRDLIFRCIGARREEKSAEAELEADLICTPAATELHRRPFSANFVGEGNG